MAHGKVTAIVPAPSAAVFDLLHDYDRRLEWDTLLRAAYLDDGFTSAEQGATSVCVGRWTVGGFALKTVYVTFDRPKVAAVKLVNRPPSSIPGRHRSGTKTSRQTPPASPTPTPSPPSRAGSASRSNR